MLSKALLLLGSVAATTAYGAYKIDDFSATNYGYAVQLSTTDGNTDYPTLTAEVIAAQDNLVRIRIEPTDASPGPKPFIIPDIVFPQGSKKGADYPAPSFTPTYQASIDRSNAQVPIFVLSHNNKRVFTTDFSLLSFQKQLVNFTYAYPEGAKVSGYMERNYDYFLGTDGKPVTLSLWNTDNGTPWKNPMYANYPIFWFNDPTSATYNAVLNMNAHAQQATVDPTASTINLINIGGILDLHVFLTKEKNTAMEVIQAYQRYVGPAAVPPYWSLGTHQCRWGYNTLDEFKAVPIGYKNAGIPLEVMWNDIDYMDNFKVFTYDPTRYAGLPDYVRELQAGGQKYIQIVDPGVATQNNYSVYESGEAADIFMKLGNKTMVGVVWPGWTAFPDFSSAAARQWWIDQVKLYSKDIKLDGIWTDMNEIASFCGGACPVAPGTAWSVDWATVNWATFDQEVCQKNNCSAVNSTLNNPPFNPLTNWNQLYTKTPDMEAVTSLGKYYDTKMFYSNLENIATNDALQAVTPGKRPFILTRSAFVGAGRTTFHWLGDNNAAFSDLFGGMVSSINGNMGSNLGGIFMVGADIPGFGGNKASEELADRWYQLGSYYTFMRNHKALGANDDNYQEPYLYSKTAQKSFIQAIERRYRLLPYIFSALMDGTLYGIPVTNHPSVVFSDQPALYEESTAFMLGTALYVAPAVTEGSDAAVARLPTGLWYNLADELTSPVVTTVANGDKVTFTVPRFTPIPAFQRAGTMIPMHKEAKMLVADTKATGYRLVFALDTEGRARGQLNLDTEDSVITPSNVFTMQYTAVGDATSGYVALTYPNGNGAVPNFPELLNGEIVLMFPAGSSLQAATLTASVIDSNGESVALKTSTPVAGKYVIELGTTVSVAAFNSIRWTATVEPSNDHGSHDSRDWKSAFVIAVAVLGGSVVVALAAIGLLIRRKRAEYEDGETLPLNTASA